MLCFNDILTQQGIDPMDVNVMLHSPKEAEFAKVLPSLVRTRPAAFESFQASHNSPAENTLKGGRRYVASFVQIHSGRMVFVGLFENHGYRVRPMGDIWQDAEIQFLHETYGLDYGQGGAIPAEQIFAWFDLRPADLLAEYHGRLLVQVNLGRTYVRLCENLAAPIVAILEDGEFDAPPPDWHALTVSAAMIRAIPPGWASRLREWRGVYLIVDESDGARYVGAAYGAENLLGRWRDHVARAREVTKELATRETINFRFSILQLLAPDAEARCVIQIERSWMERLHTIEYGLNT